MLLTATSSEPQTASSKGHSRWTFCPAICEPLADEILRGLAVLKAETVLESGSRNHFSRASNDLTTQQHHLFPTPPP